MSSNDLADPFTLVPTFRRPRESPDVAVNSVMKVNAARWKARERATDLAAWRAYAALRNKEAERQAALMETVYAKERARVSAEQRANANSEQNKLLHRRDRRAAANTIQTAFRNRQRHEEGRAPDVAEGLAGDDSVLELTTNRRSAWDAGGADGTTEALSQAFTTTLNVGPCRPSTMGSAWEGDYTTVGWYRLPPHAMMESTAPVVSGPTPQWHVLPAGWQTSAPPHDVPHGAPPSRCTAYKETGYGNAQGYFTSDAPRRGAGASFQVDAIERHRAIRQGIDLEVTSRPQSARRHAAARPPLPPWAHPRVLSPREIASSPVCMSSTNPASASMACDVGLGFGSAPRFEPPSRASPASYGERVGPGAYSPRRAGTRRDQRARLS